MTPETFKELLEQYRAGVLTTARKQELMDVLHSPERRAELERLFPEDFSLADGQEPADPETLELIFQHIRLGIERTPPVRHFYGWRPYAAAAVIALIILAGMYWRTSQKKAREPAIVKTYYKNDVKPGGSHAVLTLANGAQILLDSAGKGSLGVQGTALITKINTGSLSYKSTGRDARAVYYNTITTPAGGQYQVTLADGTQVWLNALSSLTFPTSFNGADRSVEMTGEGYFEVAANRNKPFHVKVDGVDVEVLGTHFNVNAYADETSMKTTLLEGAVRLVKGHSTITLKPGEQCQDRSGSPDFVLVKNADTDGAVAWKNGYFSFEGADIHAVMRQISRWYNVDIRYEGAPTRSVFDGEIGRNLNLKQVLTGLSKSEVHFHLEGATLTVLP